MFIRQTTKSKKGKKYFQHQLIESIRTPKGPRQRLILNLGTIELPKEQWKDLANAIEARVHGYKTLFKESDEITKLADHFAALILKSKLNEAEEKRDIDSEIQEPVYETVDITTVSNSDSRTIGAEHAALSMIEEYGFDKILKELNFTEKEINYAKMLIVGRLVHPGSERETVRWLKEDSGLIELLKTDIKIYDNALHRVSKLLVKHHKEIEKKLSVRAKRLFSLEETIILYDLTNTYFEGSKKESSIANHGKSKDKRDNSPLVTLALTVDGDGFPKHSEVFKGNIGEPVTLKGILKKLEENKDFSGLSKTIVIDAGIATEDNLALIKENGFKYIAVSRKKSYDEDFWNGSKEEELELSNKNNKLKLKLVKKGDEVWVHCSSKFKESKERAIIEQKYLKFEKELKKIQENLSKKRTRKSYPYILEKIGRLKERYGVGSMYDIKIESSEDKVVSLRFRRNPKGEAKEEDAGSYVSRTNRVDLDEGEISKLHRSLSIIENSFRAMKSHLGLRPIHHQNDTMTEGHLFISVLGYHIVAGILKKLQRAGINYNWDTVRKILSSHVRVTTSFKTKEQAVINVRNSTVPTIKQQEIYKSLKIKSQPLKSVYAKIPLKMSENKSVVMKNNS